jgi:hypothetical protein
MGLRPLSRPAVKTVPDRRLALGASAALVCSADAETVECG